MSVSVSTPAFSTTCWHGLQLIENSESPAKQLKSREVWGHAHPQEIFEIYILEDSIWSNFQQILI